MSAATTCLPSIRPIRFLSCCVLAAGAAGMGVSYLYLASSHALDVLAGAAGFVAGSAFVASGLIALALVMQIPGRMATGAAAPIDIRKWLSHFQRNQDARPEPAWDAPMTLAADVVEPLVHSLEQFQLGDGGGPAYLIAWNRDRFLADGEGMRDLVNFWFKEEREHSRLLGAAVARLGGRCIQGHWSFTAFCFTRRWFGVRFELTVLLLTEIVSTVYYRLLRRHTNDAAIRSMCRLILRDETGHVAFHRDRLATAARNGEASHGKIWEGWFVALGFAAATMLWVNHAAGLRSVGASRREFYREVRRELRRFIRRLHKESKREPKLQCTTRVQTLARLLPADLH